MIPLVNILRSRWDTDALDYLRRSAAADGQPSTPERMMAVNELVKALKDTPSPVAGVSNWETLKACCLLAGPRTLAGALVPLRGPAPTNFNFVSGDYSATTGLKGDGSTKYLNTNFSSSNTNINNCHIAAFTSDLFWQGVHHTMVACTDGAETGLTLLNFLSPTQFRPMLMGNSGDVAYDYENAKGLAGAMRDPNDLGAIHYQVDEGSGRIIRAADQPVAANYFIFRRYSGSATYSPNRISFYSVGEAIDLAALRSTVNAYMEAIS